jgi:hypothetical protein
MSKMIWRISSVISLAGMPSMAILPPWLMLVIMSRRVPGAAPGPLLLGTGDSTNLNRPSQPSTNPTETQQNEHTFSSNGELSIYRPSHPKGSPQEDVKGPALIGTEFKALSHQFWLQLIPHLRRRIVVRMVRNHEEPNRLRNQQDPRNEALNQSVLFFP